MFTERIRDSCRSLEPPSAVKFRKFVLLQTHRMGEFCQEVWLPSCVNEIVNTKHLDSIPVYENMYGAVLLRHHTCNEPYIRL